LKKDMARPAGWAKILFSELIASTIIVFLGLASRVTTSLNLTAQALSTGAAYSVTVLLFDKISGAHVTPSITVALVLYELSVGKVHWIYVLYPVAQYAGAIVGVLLLSVLTGSLTLSGLGAPEIAAGVSDARGFGVETVSVFLISLVFVLTYALWDTKEMGDTTHERAASVWDTKEPRSNKEVRDTTHERAASVFFMVMGVVFSAGTINGANLSTTRYLALITLAGDAPSNWWIFVFAPVVGGLAAGLVAAGLVYLNTTRRVNVGIPLQQAGGRRRRRFVKDDV